MYGKRLASYRVFYMPAKRKDQSQPVPDTLNHEEPKAGAPKRVRRSPAVKAVASASILALPAPSVPPEPAPAEPPEPGTAPAVLPKPTPAKLENFEKTTWIPPGGIDKFFGHNQPSVSPAPLAPLVAMVDNVESMPRSVSWLVCARAPAR